MTPTSLVDDARRLIAARVARDIPDGWSVNLGIGMPTLVASEIGQREVIFHSENGVLGVGPRPRAEQLDPDLVDAGKEPITLIPGGALMSHVESFALIRGGHLDLVVLGAYEVSESGDLANWSTGGGIPAVGGAMDLSVGAKQVWIMTDFIDSKSRRPKLVTACRYPLTAAAVVKRVYTDVGTFQPAGDGFLATELAPGMSLDELNRVGGAPLRDAPSGLV